MKFFTKKVDSGSIRTLNEKEIQKKLYGFYHKETFTSAALQNQNRPTSLFTTSGMTPSKKLVVTADQIKNLFIAVLQPVLKIARTFPWKFAFFFLSLCVLGTLLFQVISVPIKSFVRQSKSAQEKASIENIAQTEKKTSSQVVLSPPNAKVEAPKKSSYAVQICTYQKEQDAQDLTKQLNSAQFSAFHLKMSSSKGPYYVVFLGKEESFVEAQAQLKQFQRSGLSEKFKDAYVRSV